MLSQKLNTNNGFFHQQSRKILLYFGFIFDDYKFRIECKSMPEKTTVKEIPIYKNTTTSTFITNNLHQFKCITR